MFSPGLPLLLELPNNGRASFTIPASLASDGNKHRLPLLPVVVQVEASQAFLESILGEHTLVNIDPEGVYVGKHSSVRLLDATEAEQERSQRCTEWAGSQRVGVGQRLRESLPPCPCTEGEAALNSSNFTRESLSSYTSSPLQPGVQGLSDDSYRQYFHKDASICYRQNVTFT